MGASIHQLNAQMKRFSGRYIWVRRDGREYLIRDETTILRAEALFAPEARLSPEHEAIAREERRLDRDLDRLEDKDDRTAEENRELHELRVKSRDIERRERELDRRQEALEREAERGFWTLMDDAIRTGTAKPLAD
jgi:DNA repair exonuclease SbcCD ATPase subunit